MKVHEEGKYKHKENNINKEILKNEPIPPLKFCK